MAGACCRAFFLRSEKTYVIGPNTLTPATSVPSPQWAAMRSNSRSGAGFRRLGRPCRAAHRMAVAGLLGAEGRRGGRGSRVTTTSTCKDGYPPAFTGHIDAVAEEDHPVGPQRLDRAAPGRTKERAEFAVVAEGGNESWRIPGQRSAGRLPSPPRAIGGRWPAPRQIAPRCVRAVVGRLRHRWTSSAADWPLRRVHHAGTDPGFRHRAGLNPCGCVDASGGHRQRSPGRRRDLSCTLDRSTWRQPRRRWIGGPRRSLEHISG